MAESGGGGRRGADGNTYKRFSLSDSKQNSLSFLLPSEDNEELITEIKQPSLSSVNLTDSVCSSNSFSSNNNFFRFSEAEFNENNEIHNKVVENDVKPPVTVVDDSTCNNSEPEDMQDFITMYDNFNKSDLVKSIADHDGNINEKTIEPLFDYHKTYRPATSSPLLRNRKMSLSLQDVSTIDIFPLESKTLNAFSTETIQTQSMSSTTKSKDSGFQRSASCLSLNSGNRSYEHIQSKVKQYIKDIKTSEAQRKKQKREQNVHLEIPKSKNSSILNLNSSENLNKFEPKELLDTIKSLRTELKELKLNYNALFEKYAKAVNQIDLMRLRSSLNYSSYRSDCYSDINSDVIVDNQQNYSSFNNNTSVWSNKLLSPNSNSTNHNNNNKNINLNEESPITNQQNIVNKSNKDDLFFTPISNSDSINISNCDKDDELLQISEFSRKTFTHSTPVNSIKSVTLRPISRMYSSSSRLDKKISPLPSSSSSSNKCLTKKKNTIINKENVESLNKNCDKDDNKSGTLIAGDDDNDDDVFYRKSYLNCRSISQLELPRDDPFEKVQKWQASLPTMSLIDTQSNSSFGSLDNIDLKPHSHSLDRNLNQDFYDNSNRRQKETKSFNRNYNFKFNSSYRISQSDQNLTMINNPRIYSKVYDNGNSSTSNKKNSRRSSKNVLKRTNAVDDINEFSNNELKFSSSSNVKKRLFTEPLTSCEKEKNLTNLDESSSMSSSILSSPKHKETVTGKDKNKQPKVNEKRTKKIIEKLSSSTFLKDTRNKIQNKNKSLSLDYDKNSNENTLKKRVCFTPVNRNKISTNEKPIQKYAWESPKHVVNSLQKSDSTINKSSITTSQPVNNNKPNFVRHRTETLKSFTEILNCDINSSSGYNKLRDSAVGSDKDSSDNKNSEEILTDKSLMASDNYNKDLEDVEQRVKYVRKEVDRILKSLNNMKCTGAVNTN